MIETLADLFVLRGVPTHIRSDNGPEFIADAVKDPLIELEFALRRHRGHWTPGNSTASTCPTNSASPMPDTTAPARRTFIG